MWQLLGVEPAELPKRGYSPRFHEGAATVRSKREPLRTHAQVGLLDLHQSVLPMQGVLLITPQAQV